MDDGDFDLVVEEAGSSPQFALPEGWACEERMVGDLTVTTVAPLPDSAAKRHANGLPIVTFHDVGLSASTCFASFFNYAHTSGTCPEAYSASAHYHITAAGCAPDAPALPVDHPYQSFEQLGKAVLLVLDAIGAKRIVGFGVGAGASVLVHAALVQPKSFAGLVLVSPLLRASGYAERAYSRMDGAVFRGLGLGRRLKDRFLRRWLAPETIEENSELVAVLDDSLDRLNGGNVARFMEAEAWRDSLVDGLRSVPGKVLLFAGKGAELHLRDASEHFAHMDPAKTAFVDVPGAGSLVHEEHPDQVARALALFLQGFGAVEGTAPKTVPMYQS